MRSLAKREIERLDRLIDGLAHPAHVDATVHATRKGIKRLRAFLRLARKSAGTTTYRVENAALRDTGLLLGPARDGYVLIDTARSLDADAAVIEELEERHRVALADLESGRRIETRRRLEAIAARWRIHVAADPDASSIGAGLERTYRRALVDYERVLATPTAAAFHGWRRRAKYIRYQLEALEAPATLVRGYLELGDDLGLEHDHTVLLAVCTELVGRDGFAELAARADERREALRMRATARGEELFIEEPGSYRRTVVRAVDIA